ncbi:MAG TPA: Stk1 family PASTA domain-containing Ser/Thr kinase [Marmoricola sp.]|jgi:serine/threonine-protein kinase|nr:Stk1 family PASTA domain-containing Ser/Thr kinase [Marmoricola sp.]
MADPTGPHRIGGRYEIGELLGRGGMAEVRKGTDIRLGRTVAVKRLRTDLASDATFQARFRREAQSAASLNHPAIVSVYDTGEELAEDSAGGPPVAQPYIVMEYVAGRTLRDILREGRKILPERALEIASGTLGALDYSHRAGIIHRDIKPANVMLTPAGDVKVMDFGIARAVSDAQNTMTQTAAVVGTAQYLSPEQARGETVDSRSDVYSTGCLLFELLTGRPPFIGDSPVAVAYQHVREQAQPPSTFDADLPPEVDAIVMKALAKRLEDRYQSAAAMKEDIDRFLAGRPVQAPLVSSEPVLPVGVPPLVPGMETATTSVVPGTGEWAAVDRKRRFGPITLLIVLLLAVIAGAIFFIPKLISQAPEQTSTPSVVTLTEKQAEAKITKAGLTVGEVSQHSDATIAKGTVISQDPSPTDKQFVDPGSTINLVVSSGPAPTPQVAVPNVVGQDQDDAKAQLVADQLKVVLKTVPQASTEDAGTVLSTKPAPGATVDINTTVTVRVSAGPQEVPDVTNRTQAAATQILEAAGFKVVPQDDDTSTKPAGTVTYMTPPANSTQNRGTTIFIGISTYMPPSGPPTGTPTGTPTDGISP